MNSFQEDTRFLALLKKGALSLFKVVFIGAIVSYMVVGGLAIFLIVNPEDTVYLDGTPYQKECILKNLMAVTPKYGKPPGLTIHYFNCDGSANTYTMYFRGVTQKTWDTPPRTANKE